MRNQGMLRLGYFPLPLAEARRIRAFLRFPASTFAAIDPSIGDGAAFWQLREKHARARTPSSWMHIARSRPPRLSMS